MLKKSGLSFRIYLILTAIITLLSMFFIYHYAMKQRQLLIQEKQTHLLKIANVIEQQLDNYELAHDIEQARALPGGDAERQQFLNRVYQPVMERISLEYPNTGLGIYLREIGIVAITPNFDPDVLKKPFDPTYLTSYKTGRTEFLFSDSSVNWRGKAIIAVTYPLVYRGEMIGHTWANAKMEEVEAEIAGVIMKWVFFGFIFWLIAIMIVYVVFNRLQMALAKMAQQIKDHNDDATTFQSFPELLPVFETVIDLRNQLNSEYADKIRLQEEMAKFDRFQIVGELAAAVTHEIRNPMTTVQGYLQLIKKKYPETDRYLDVALEELHNANDIIEDFLSLARNRLTEQEECSLNELIDRLQPLLYADCVKSNLSLALDLEPSLPPLRLNVREIRQLILNIARNGIDAMTPGTGTLTIKTESREQNLVLSISDTGCGIPAEMMEKIFEPFHTTKTGGTGLGLFICLSIVEKHHGKITVHSTVGAGTTFVITFPCGQSRESEPGRPL